MNNPFTNIFATNNNGSKTNNSLFPNSGLFNSNPGRQESSSSQFNLFNNNPNSNNPFAQNSSNDNNKKESEGKPSLFGAPGNNAFFFGVNNSNPTNPPNNFSPSDTKDKKEEPRGGPWASKALSYHVASQDHTMGMEADDPPTTLSIPRAGKIP